MFFLALAPRAQGMTEGIAYRGRLTAVEADAFDGRLPMTMVFRLWNSDTSGTGTLLWGRIVPVVVGTDGVFSLVLTDSTGTPIRDNDGNDTAKYSSLAYACAEGASVYLGLTPGVLDTIGEFERSKVAIEPEAQVSAVAKTAGSLSAPSVAFEKLTVKGTATVDRLDLSEAEVNILGLKIGEKVTKLELKAEDGDITVYGYQPEVKYSTDAKSNAVAECDKIVYRKDTKTGAYYCELVPAGATYSTDSAMSHASSDL